ncbi:MAG: molybdopterin dehydrogenase [Deltaproteobacteria bacterium RBG_13_53_10]|nr:MAG: molybdopterin dehydrogenase [Deltaproteobacteria bacterium RBG_13_53_10]
MGIPDFTYVKVRSLREAIDQLSLGGAGVHAGGTDLLGCLRDDVFKASKVVSLGQLKELRGITQTPDGVLRIGALTTLTEIAHSRIVNETYPGLARAVSEVASPQLRNQGTLGGNLCQKPRCWYYRGEFHCMRKGGDKCYALQGENQFHCIFGGNMCYMVHPSDTAPVLVAFEAIARVAGPGGTRTVPLGKFHVPPGENVEKETVLEPNEIFTDILLPPPGQRVRSSYRKVRVRQSWDFALAGVALVIRFNEKRVEQARVVLSGAAPVPWRSMAVEEAITGKELNAETVAKAADAVVKNAEPLKHNRYKLSLFRGIVEEELAAISQS